MALPEPETINPFNMWQGAFIPNWIMRRSEITATAKLVYGRLCQYAGRDGQAYPSIQTLADEVGIKRRQLSNVLNQLEALALIRRKPQTRDNGGKSTSIYEFLAHEWITSIHVQPVAHTHRQSTAHAHVQPVAHKENHVLRESKGSTIAATPSHSDHLLSVFTKRSTRQPYTNTQRARNEISQINDDLDAFAQAVGIETAASLLDAAITEMIGEGDPPHCLSGALYRAQQNRRQTKRVKTGKPQTPAKPTSAAELLGELRAELTAAGYAQAAANISVEVEGGETTVMAFDNETAEIARAFCPGIEVAA